jgi:hypothetical protein
MLSICIPFYAKPVELVLGAITSAATAMPEDSELLVLPNGAEACSELRNATLPSNARVLESEQLLSQVDNWNRCLNLSKGDLVHILHDDDVVMPDFYRKILDLHARFPDAALYATGKAPLEVTSPEARDEEPILLTGDDAGAFILADWRFFSGTIVMTRRVIDAKGPFREGSYSLDEEAFLRYATSGGVAFDPAPLYRTRTHEEQVRYKTWRQRDWVESYVKVRVDGATGYSPAAVELAKKSSARRVISVAVELAENGEEKIARGHLDELQRLVPACRMWPRYWFARAAARSRPLRRAAELRRRHMWAQKHRSDAT